MFKIFKSRLVRLIVCTAAFFGILGCASVYVAYKHTVHSAFSRGYNKGDNAGYAEGQKDASNEESSASTSRPKTGVVAVNNFSVFAAEVCRVGDDQYGPVIYTPIGNVYTKNVSGVRVHQRDTFTVMKAPDGNYNLISIAIGVNVPVKSSGC